MRAQMRREIGRLRERLVAFVAFVRLLPRMCAHVRFKSARPGVCLIADFASINAIVD
jgi:hypothetical protein